MVGFTYQQSSTISTAGFGRPGSSVGQPRNRNRSSRISVRSHSVRHVSLVTHEIGKPSLIRERQKPGWCVCTYLQYPERSRVAPRIDGLSLSTHTHTRQQQAASALMRTNPVASSLPSRRRMRHHAPSHTGGAMPPRQAPPSVGAMLKSSAARQRGNDWFRRACAPGLAPVRMLIVYEACMYLLYQKATSPRVDLHPSLKPDKSEKKRKSMNGLALSHLLF